MLKIIMIAMMVSAPAFAQGLTKGGQPIPPAATATAEKEGIAMGEKIAPPTPVPTPTPAPPSR